MFAKDLILEIKNHSDSKVADSFRKFFKTGVGEYSYGDEFIGVKLPILRSIVQKYLDLPLKEVDIMLNNKIHEIRLGASLLLSYKYKFETDFGKKEIYTFYIKNAKKFNNWDLVDVSAHKVVGEYLLDKNRKSLYDLINDEDKWARRIGIIATLTLIRNNDLDDVFKLSKILMKDDFDLSHKATGWMLREAGKKDEARLKKFLKENIRDVPRTTLRYAIEKFEEKERKEFLKL